MTKLMKLAAVTTMAAVMSFSAISSFAAEVTVSDTTQLVNAQSVVRTPLTGDDLIAHQKEMLAAKKAVLDARVKAGTMTQAQADAILKAIETNQLTCDGTGSGKIGQKMGAAFGSNGQGQGLSGTNKGQGMGRGMGKGMGMGQGTCTLTTPTN